MGQFRGHTIIFDGISSTQFGLYLCNVGDNRERNFGFNKTTSKTSDRFGNSILNSVTNNAQSYPIQLVKLDRFSNPLPISNEELRMISRWLFRYDEYKPMLVETETGEYIEYYGIFTRGSIWQNELDQGYVTVEFEMASPYGTLLYQDYECSVDGEKVIVLESRHDYGQYNPMDIEVHITGESMTITNETTKQSVQFSSIDEGNRKLMVYNEPIKHIVNIDNPKTNVKSKFNNEYMKLVFGDNVIKIKGQGHVKFFNRPKMSLS